MDDCSTQSFIQSFIRFACEVDCPKYILIDKDRQLVKGCDTMRLSFKYIKKDYQYIMVEPDVLSNCWA